MRKAKVKGREFFKFFTSEDAERILEAAQSEDLPENIDEIEAVATWKLDIGGKDKKAKTTQELGRELSEMLKKANVKPVPDWDMEDLAAKIIHRRYSGKTKANSLSDINKARKEEYQKVKNREPIKRLVSLSSTEEEGLVVHHFVHLDEKLKEGKTFVELINEEVYSDDPPAHLAFLMLVEELSSIPITTAKQLMESGKLEEDGSEYIERVFFTAQEYRYTLKIERLLQEGVLYPELLNVDPSVFNLPQKWPNCFDEEMNTEKVISRTIATFFKLLWTDPIAGRTNSYREVANRLKAPLSVILKAVKNYA